VDQLSSDIADDMNAEKLPIVPTKDQLHRPSVLVPVLPSAGRPHTGRLASECDALLAGVCILPGRVRGDMSGVCTVTARRRRLMMPKTQAPRSSSGDDLDQSETLYTRSGRGKGRLAATLSSCLALLVI
jgi:hypothetical protein